MHRRDRFAQARRAGRTLATWFAAVVVVVVIAGTLPVRALPRATDAAPSEQVTDAARGHLVASNSASPAATSIHSFVDRAGISSLRRFSESALSRVLSIVLAALLLLAWRRGYVAGRRERAEPSSDHSGSIYFVRGPPPSPSRYPAAVAVGNRLMYTTREDSKDAIRHRADGRAPWGTSVIC